GRAPRTCATASTRSAGRCGWRPWWATAPRCRAGWPPHCGEGAEVRAARYAWVLVVATAALALVQAVLLRASGVPLLSATAVQDGFPGIPLATVVGALVGAVILSRHPHHRVGWLFCLGQFGVAVGLAARAVGNAALSGDLPAPQA